jgi:hypothetical protein
MLKRSMNYPLGSNPQGTINININININNRRVFRGTYWNEILSSSSFVSTPRK